VTHTLLGEAGVTAPRVQATPYAVQPCSESQPLVPAVAATVKTAQGGAPQPTAPRELRELQQEQALPAPQQHCTSAAPPGPGKDTSGGAAHAVG
jgi:hypothetical protein